MRRQSCSQPIPLAAAIASVLASGSVADAVAPIFGSPAYDTVAGTGFQNPSLMRSPGGNGVAVGRADRYTAGDFLGSRAVRWGIDGATELDNIGTDSTGFAESAANAVSATGTAVGFVSKYSGDTVLGDIAARWNAGGTAVTLLTAPKLGTAADGSFDAFALTIASSGIVVGEGDRYLSNGTAAGHSVIRWAAGATTGVVLDRVNSAAAVNLSNESFSSAYALNAGGTIVGSAQMFTANGGDAGSRAVRWNASGTVATELANLGTTSSGFTDSVAQSVNTAGAAVGFAFKYTSGAALGQRAVRWDAGSSAAIELGNLGFAANNSTISNANSINDSGIAVGYARKYTAAHVDLNFHAVRWDAAGAVSELGDLGTDSQGRSVSAALWINAAGTAAGFANVYVNGVAAYYSHAVAWGVNNVPVDLNTLLSSSDSAHWLLTTAQNITNTHWIVGDAQYDPDGTGPLPAYEREFLLDAIRAFGAPGDATRDNRVNFDDLVVLAQNYNQSVGQTWDTGDFTGDGATNFDDLIVLAQHYNTGVKSLEGVSAGFAADWALAQSLVPEPTTLLLGIAAFTPLATRRRTG